MLASGWGLDSASRQGNTLFLSSGYRGVESFQLQGRAHGVSARAGLAGTKIAGSGGWYRPAAERDGGNVPRFMPRRLRIVVFIAVALAVFGGVHCYLYARLLSALAPCSRREVWALRGLMVCGAVSFPSLRILSRARVWRATALVNWIVAGWLGLVLYAFLAALALQVGAAVLQLSGLGLPDTLPVGMSPGQAGLALVSATTLVFAGIGLATAQALPRTTQVEIALAHLPPALDGFSVVQLSDLHVGPFHRTSRMRKIVERVNALAPDLVVITGDLADEKPADLAEAIGLLQDLRARHGVLAVTGNHDFFADIDSVLRRSGAGRVRFLRNESLTVAGAIDVHGVDDPLAARIQGGDPPRLEQRIGSEARLRPSILLCHQPLGYARLAEMGVGLVLSGHTHGGQLWPISWLSRRLYPHYAGHYQIGASHFYVSRGTGTWGPPMRVGAPPEIVQLRLRAPR
jgi:predicted MPP superfamily phosphohydrolase